jgi:glucosamine-6-phosphate deaminase
MPTLEGDALPMANLLRARQPDLITVAFDPEGTGPDTHYKVLQVVAAGLRISIERKDLINPNPMIWGYRNVWFIFTPSEATIMIPCSQSDLDLMHDTFMACFTTQKSASYPSPHYEGSFSAWSRHLQIQHRKTLSTLLGESFFTEHRDARVRESAGFIFLRAMHAIDFLKEVEELKSKFENVRH